MNIEIKKKIIESGKPQIALANIIGIPEAQLSKIVNGWITPSEDIKGKLSKALGCEVGDIFPQEND